MHRKLPSIKEWIESVPKQVADKKNGEQESESKPKEEGNGEDSDD